MFWSFKGDIFCHFSQSLLMNHCILQGKLHIEYLSTSDEYRSEALFANARQMLAQYQRKRVQKEEETLPIFYWPYTTLTPDKELEIVATIRNYLKTAQYDAAVSIVVVLSICCQVSVILFCRA